MTNSVKYIIRFEDIPPLLGKEQYHKHVFP